MKKLACFVLMVVAAQAAFAFAGARDRSGLERGSPGPIGLQGPQGPQGATGAAGPAGPAGLLLTDFGTFNTATKAMGSPPRDVDPALLPGVVPPGGAIPFDIDGLHTQNVERVTDITFNINQVAIAISRSGTYLITFAASVEFKAEIVLALNGQLFDNTRISLGPHSELPALTTIIDVTDNNLAQGQNGAALLEVITPTGLTLSTLPLKGDIAAYITVLRIGDPT